ncbi:MULTISPECIES: ATP-binding cassette domain-containing protein [Streptomyces]|uniref:ATP-binding cassette domain-containing protein n=1 Tax=Streptomyces flavovirens TaxID=52258 RepID=A0ABV8NCG5_9ACTN|nr:ATP-binding cassette domain-containing protein [Streptomyces sp. MBT51]MBK3591429.1 ATP-binding cassette domain-containing protein [Streptomyces sp. MBT51]
MLRGVGLVLPPGTLVRVEGANGTGKSTLLRLLAGIDAPTEGRVTGRPRTAYVPERFPAALPFTASGYLVHMGRVHGLDTARAVRRADEWLTRFGAAGYARTPMRELSKGTSQKVAVAQALLAEPGLLVLDEAWTGLDATARAELDRAVTERVAAGATVVFVDHDPRRLAGSVDTTYRLDGRTLVPAQAAPPGPRTARRVRIEAVGPAVLPPKLPGAPEVERDADDPARVRLTVAATHSDGLLRTLLGARPPWHVTALAPAGDPAPPDPAPGESGPVGAVGTEPSPDAHVAPGRRADLGTPGRPALALTRCQAALLARSQRWLAPVLLYAAFLGVGVQAGQPLLDSLGYAAAALLPVAAWLTRICVTQEPPATRAVAAAAAGPGRVHLAALTTALGCALVLGGAATGYALLTGDPADNGRTVAVPLPPAAVAGLLAAACCALLGTAVGALCARPVLHRRGWSLAATVLGVLLALVTDGSPAGRAVTGLVSGSRDGTVRVPLLASAGAVLVAAAVAAGTARLASRRE